MQEQEDPLPDAGWQEEFVICKPCHDAKLRDGPGEGEHLPSPHERKLDWLITDASRRRRTPPELPEAGPSDLSKKRRRQMDSDEEEEQRRVEQEVGEEEDGDGEERRGRRRGRTGAEEGPVAWSPEISATLTPLHHQLQLEVEEIEYVIRERIPRKTKYQVTDEP
ncbi:hypothetical protein LENED_008643 [Lentinula edodes]|uniref:Uncharacterized protein n=1 Tax=Lentinula edodes TaxID=5353 RepID=A0A1Q3EHN6_LENED|nr:hypothetical protein LENED_008643 [Lentinula edodes]